MSSLLRFQIHFAANALSFADFQFNCLGTPSAVFDQEPSTDNLQIQAGGTKNDFLFALIPLASSWNGSKLSWLEISSGRSVRNVPKREHVGFILIFIEDIKWENIKKENKSRKRREKEACGKYLDTKRKIETSLHRIYRLGEQKHFFPFRKPQNNR